MESLLGELKAAGYGDMQMCMCISICMCVYVYLCVCMYIHVVASSVDLLVHRPLPQSALTPTSTSINNRVERRKLENALAKAQREAEKTKRTRQEEQQEGAAGVSVWPEMRVLGK
jgi:Flp pilus assembly protein TadB